MSDDKGEYLFELKEGDKRGKLRSAPGVPYDVAQEFIAEWMGERLVWRGNFYKYARTHWVMEDTQDVMSEINRELGNSYFQKWVKDRYVDYAWSPNNTSLANLKTQLLLQAARPSTDEPVQGGEFIFLANGRYSISTGVLLEHDPAIFNLHASPFAYDPKAVCPEWDRFLKETFDGDQDSIDTHYLWMAYELLGATDLQKGYMLLGDKRSGKGTLMHISDTLIGLAQTTAMSLRDFGTEFGMAPLIGKSVCRLNDVRDAGKDATLAVERLLGIIGGDPMSINRKGLNHWVGQLGVRFALSSNEVPRLPDANNAIGSRFVLNRTAGSHLGHEDFGLRGRIIAGEMPGVLNRVLDYVDRVYDKWPVSARVGDITSAMNEASSPVQAWMNDLGVRVGPEEEASCKEVYLTFSSWAHENGYRPVNDATFGRMLRACVSDLSRTYRGPRGNQVRVYQGLGLPS